VTSGALQTGDSFTAITESYSGKNAGTGIMLTPSAVISDGNAGNNYTVTLVTATNGTINRAPVTITAQTDTKTYDGSTVSAGTPLVTSGALVGTDGFSSLTQAFSNANAGTGKTLIPAFVINDGNSGANYQVTLANNITGVINALPVTLAGHRSYDGLSDTSAAAGLLSVTDLVAGDTVTVASGAGTVNDGSAGAHPLTSLGTLALSGTSASNYTLVGGSGTLTIDPLSIAIALTGSRVYDGTTSVAPSTVTITNNLDGTNLLLIGSGTLASPNVGTESLTSTAGALTGFTLSGSAAANYTTTGGMGTVTILARPITVAAQTDTRTYNGTQASSVVPVLTAGTLAGTDTNGFLQTFSTRNVGTGLTLTPSGSVNDGNSGHNYAVTFVNNSTGVITPELLTVVPVTSAKVYDGTTASTGIPTLVVGSISTGDSASLTQTFASKNVGTGLILTPSASINDGNGGNNYTITLISENLGSITPRPLVVTAQSNLKTYDTTTTAAATPAITSGSIATGDTAAFTENYGSKNAGTNVSLVPTGTVSDGNGGNNYNVTFQTASTGTINPAILILAVAPSTKTYDSTTSSPVAPTVTGLLPGDTSSGSAVEVYSDPNAGTGKTVTALLGSLAINDGNGGNNYILVPINSTAGVITPEPLILRASTNTKTYDGTVSAAAVPSITGGSLQGTDAFTTLTEAYQSKNAGSGLTLVPSYAVSDGNGGANYSVTLVNNTSGVINPATVVLAANAATKIYDGTNMTTVAPTLGTLVAGDSATGVAVETFDTKNAGSGKTLIPAIGSLVISDGNSGANYNVILSTNAGGVINQATLLVSAVAAIKTYDGSTASSTAPTVSGLTTGDTYTGSGIESYSTRNAGTGLTLSPTLGSISVNDGNGGNNYQVQLVPNGSGVINPFPITLAATANTKIYDGTTGAAAAPSITSGSLQGTDTFTTNTEAYAGKNVGTGLTLTPTVVINDGNGGNNYVVTTQNNTTGVISQAIATLTANAATKTYDGTMTTVVTPSFAGLATGDTTTGAGSETFDNPNAGTGKTLTPTLGTLTINDGNGGNNYIVAIASGGNGTINPLPVQLTVTGGRLYDGTTNAPSSILSIANNIDGTNLSLAGSGILVSKNVGPEPLATSSGQLTGLSLTGSAAGNYTVTGGSGIVTVSPVAITVSAVPNTKTYDGTTSAVATPLLTSGSLQAGDGFGALNETYASRNAGTGLTLIPTDVINDGNGGNNYVVTLVNNTTGTINKAFATLTATSAIKTYDGTNSSSALPTIVGLISGDTASGAGSQTYNDSTAGTGKTLTPSLGALTINDGNGGNNYLLSSANAAGTISPLMLTASLAGNVSKTYDSTANASLSAGNYVLSGALAGDDVALNDPLSGTYADKNVGTGKTVTVAGLALMGGNAVDYTVAPTISDTVGTITPKTILASLTGSATKVYDGTLSATLLPANYVLSGAYTGDAVAVTTPGSAAYDTKSTGTQKTVTAEGLALSGSDADNYLLASSTAAGNIGTITPKAVTAGLTGSVAKTYDGTTVATLTGGNYTFSGVLSGDVVSISEPSVGTYSDKNAGSGKVVTVTGVALSGADAADYSLSSTETAAIGTITPKQITAVVDANNKVYDGTTAATGTVAELNGVVGGDAVSATADFAFTNRNVGTNKVVTVSDVALTGADADDYTLAALGATTASITPRDLTVTAATNAKLFDGTTSAAATPTLTTGSLASGDHASLAETYASSSVGKGLTLTPTAAISDGNGGANYLIMLIPNETGVIAAAAQSASGIAASGTLLAEPDSSKLPLLGNADDFVTAQWLNQASADAGSDAILDRLQCSSGASCSHRAIDIRSARLATGHIRLHRQSNRTSAHGAAQTH
jgi:hypothetical protein